MLENSGTHPLDFRALSENSRQRQFFMVMGIAQPYAQVGVASGHRHVGWVCALGSISGIRLDFAILLDRWDENIIVLSLIAFMQRTVIIRSQKLIQLILGRSHLFEECIGHFNNDFSYTFITK